MHNYQIKIPEPPGKPEVLRDGKPIPEEVLAVHCIFSIKRVLVLLRKDNNTVEMLQFDATAMNRARSMQALVISGEADSFVVDSLTLKDINELAGSGMRVDVPIRYRLRDFFSRLRQRH